MENEVQSETASKIAKVKASILTMKQIEKLEKEIASNSAKIERARKKIEELATAL